MSIEPSRIRAHRQTKIIETKTATHKQHAFFTQTAVWEQHPSRGTNFLWAPLIPVVCVSFFRTYSKGKCRLVFRFLDLTPPMTTSKIGDRWRVGRIFIQSINSCKDHSIWAIVPARGFPLAVSGTRRTPSLRDRQGTGGSHGAGVVGVVSNFFPT